MDSKQPQQFSAPYGYEGKGLSAYSSQMSPRIILEILLEKIKLKSALDIGCGIGIWSKVLIDKNVDVVSIDGEWIPKENIQIPLDKFLIKDITKEFRLNKKFDLVICLEVAEHIPESHSDALLNNIIEHGDLVLFSAAIPGQGGFEHINEQWQSYWVDRFEAKGYSCYDIIRPQVWGNDEVRFYYQQNAFVFVKKSTISAQQEVFLNQSRSFGYDVVHPKLYDRVRNPENISLRNVVRFLPKILKNYLSK